METITRYFTQREAEKTLPLVKSIVTDILAEGREVKKLGLRMTDEEINESDEIRDRLERINVYINELEEIGCYYKDWNFTLGIVDFPAILNGEEVYLCWRSDEETIQYYHPMHDGYNSRKEIPQE